MQAFSVDSASLTEFYINNRTSAQNLLSVLLLLCHHYKKQGCGRLPGLRREKKQNHKHRGEKTEPPSQAQAPRQPGFRRNNSVNEAMALGLLSMRL